MRRPFVLAAFISLLLGASACTERTKESAAPDQSACEELLGDAGLKWLESRTGGPGKVHTKSTDGLDKARSLFYTTAEKWDTDGTTAISFPSADVCEARVDTANPERQLSFRYGPSTLFDFPFRKASSTGERTTVPVNSDVVMTYNRPNHEGAVSYRIFVTCKIPGTSAGQENEIPLTGELTDTLTGETSTRVHLTRLLHSARVMAKTFDCQNNPVVPAEPPASVT
ncbi:hypothetical protein ACFXBB_22035 [Streptomyces scopuliridis]|uniref:hypothetical protein n=1 Tax=Streptomyces scopuliridis TaxID=452529 RepID=UPI0036B098D8